MSKPSPIARYLNPLHEELAARRAAPIEAALLEAPEPPNAPPDLDWIERYRMWWGCERGAALFGSPARGRFYSRAMR